MSDAATLHSPAASLARLEETLAAERAADKKETINYFDLCIAELRLIKDTMNKAEEEKAKAKKEREDAEARMWQGFVSLFSWKHMKAD